MTHEAGIPLGIRFKLLSDTPQDSAAQVVSEVVVGDYRDLDTLRDFARGCDVITFDHEHVPTEHLRALEASLPHGTVDPKTWKRELYHYLRWALLGGKRGPGIAETMDILGRETCVKRIQDANMRAREVEDSKSRPVLKEEGWRGDVEGKRRVGKDWKAYSL